ncbi:Uncharacterised protein [Bordetella pertussis]|nr:Uncharacterised protein [Bordetella pertussis]CFT96322.1 Uncharacterised protein [Bordetella pertussis]CPJ05004.1 Uncharacterised protein [Bordetella pertussis]CPO68108.1 Uncharacterised protein [Bordetella pertussis]
MGGSSYSTLPSSSLTRHVPQPPKVHSCAIRTLARVAASSTDSPGSALNCSPVSIR